MIPCTQMRVGSWQSTMIPPYYPRLEQLRRIGVQSQCARSRSTGVQPTSWTHAHHPNFVAFSCCCMAPSYNCGARKTSHATRQHHETSTDPSDTHPTCRLTPGACATYATAYFRVWGANL